jgi:hypothetical protein
LLEAVLGLCSDPLMAGDLRNGISLSTCNGRCADELEAGNANEKWSDLARVDNCSDVGSMDRTGCCTLPADADEGGTVTMGAAVLEPVGELAPSGVGCTSDCFSGEEEEACTAAGATLMVPGESCTCKFSVSGVACAIIGSEAEGVSAPATRGAGGVGFSRGTCCFTDSACCSCSRAESCKQ